jgi:hypothetical protein
MTGVSSIASIGPIRNRFPEISRTTTRCSPKGLADAVSFAKTLSGGAAAVLERIEGCGTDVVVHAPVDSVLLRNAEGRPRVETNRSAACEMCPSIDAAA